MTAAPATAGTARPATGAARAAAGAAAVTVASVLPVFLVGGVSVQMAHDLRFSPAGLGLAVAAYYAVSAATAVPAGGVVARLGPIVTGRFAVTLAAAVMLAIGGLAHGYPTFVGLLALGAVTNAFGQLSANLLIARALPAGRQGIGFAVKQSALPAATLLAGAAVPAIALTAGWRWAFVLAGLLALGALPLMPQVAPGEATVRARGRRDLRLLVLAAGAGLATAATNCLGAFLVASTVRLGVSPGAAGLTLTLGSLLCITARLGGGWWADRFRGDLLVAVTGLLVAGAAGVALLAVGSPAALAAGVGLAFGVGWSWPGLFNLSVVRRYPRSPAEATGVTSAGVYVGGCAGPLGFGVLAAHAGFGVAWTATAAVMLGGAACMLLGCRLLNHST